MKYVIRFKKTGVICYTSHLDIMKVFKRAFKRAGIRLAYSQGFNPHPKMGFAQPLSLGYEGLDEYIEFETAADQETEGAEILEKLREIMPEGLELLSVEVASHNKTLAANTVAADYVIEIPFPDSKTAERLSDSKLLWHQYMDQDEIIVLKKQKKKKEPAPVNIRPKIREMLFYPSQEELRIEACLDSGSESNLSPELIIESILRMLDLDVPRSNISVTRTKIHFKERLT